MAFGQLHSTGTLCAARTRCPLEGEGGHFDSIQALVTHTAEDTGAPIEEIEDVLSSGVSPKEVVSMAREGLLGRSLSSSATKSADVAPEKVELKQPGSITLDLNPSFRDVESIEKTFISELESRGFPVAEFEDLGDGRFSFTVEAEGDPNDYSLLMAGSEAAASTQAKTGMDEEELEEYSEWLDISAELKENSGERG